MKQFYVFIFLIITVSCREQPVEESAELELEAGQEKEVVIPFDVGNPGLLRPGNIYEFTLATRPDEKTRIQLIPSEEETMTNQKDGSTYAAIHEIRCISSEGEAYTLSYEHMSYGVPNIDVEDYDGDGSLDFRVISEWGSGGSWYCYYRYVNGKYERWEAAENLGINNKVNDLLAVYGRAGPVFVIRLYQFKDEKFSEVRSVRVMDSLEDESIAKNSYITRYRKRFGDKMMELREPYFFEGEKIDAFIDTGEYQGDGKWGEPVKIIRH